MKNERHAYFFITIPPLLISRWANDPHDLCWRLSVVDETVRPTGIEIKTVSLPQSVNLILDHEIKFAGNDISEFLTAVMRIESFAAALRIQSLSSMVPISSIPNCGS
jgi:hypothetical protein